MVKTILFTGDSHTCGQGADGFTMTDESVAYNPYNGEGIGRNMRFYGRDYVNLVREEVDKLTGSESVELTFDRLAGMFVLDTRSGCAIVTKPITLKGDESRDSLYTLRFAARTEPAEARLTSPGRDEKLTLAVKQTRYGELSLFDIPVWLEAGGSVTVTPISGEVLIESAARYAGEYAVIRQGVGCCNTVRMADICFPYCAEVFRPHIVVAEAHTINDWLTRCTPETYRENLARLLVKFGGIAERAVILLTVSPVCGAQAMPHNDSPYNDFIEASRGAAVGLKINCPLIMADANAAMERELAGLGEAERFERLFADNWHVNNLGHRIYADEVMKALKPIL